jgi:hypothetical protein
MLLCHNPPVLPSAVRGFLLLLLSLWPAALALADWELGSQSLGPAPGSRTQASAAASSHDALAVWVDGRSGEHDLLAVRMDAQGETLATIRQRRTSPGWSTVPLVATDGENYLIVSAKTRMWVATIDRQNKVIERELDLAFRPTSVTWNGSHYLVTSGNRMILLHRDGSLASGVLSVGTLAEYSVLSVASRGGRWFVIDAHDSRRGMISAEDFPPAGTERTMALPDPHSFAGPVALTTWGAGYVSVREGYGLRMSVDSYDVDGRLIETRSVAVVRPIVDPGLRILERNGSLYVAYRTAANATEVVRLRVQGRRTVRLVPRPEDGSGYSVSSLGTVKGLPGALVATSAGVLSVWLSASDHQIFRALVPGPQFRRGGILLSADRARQRSPRIASMPGAHLVAWLEYRVSTRVVVAVLSDDARQASEPYILPLAADNEPPHVASDGVNFLVICKSAGAYQGVIVSREGTIQGQPFEVPVTESSRNELFSVAWNGVAYAVTGPGQTTLVATNGTILETASTKQKNGDPGPYGQFLARDGDRMLVLDFDVDWPTLTAPIGIRYETSVRRADLTELPPENAIDRAWTGRRFESGIETMPPAPAMAAGGGHRLIARREQEVFSYSTELRPIEITGDSFTHIERAPLGPALHASWNGSGFFVAVGSTLLRHAPAGELVERQSLGGGILESNVAIGSVPFVVMVREAGVPRLFVRPLDH